jgi:hypothetical protein
MKIPILTLLFFISTISYACDCVTETLVNRIQYSDFIAKVKVLNASAPTVDGEYQTAEIEVLDLYKGVKTKSINIHSAFQTSCMMSVEKNTTWLVFAHYGKSGGLEFGACSGSLELGKKINNEKYPNLEEKIKRTVDLKISVLKYFKKKRIDKPNPYNFYLNLREADNDQLKGYDVKGDRYAVYKLKIEKDLTISNIRALKKLGNRELSNKIEEILMEREKIKLNRLTEINAPTILIVVVYYYPAEGDYKSFISLFDV